jgi:hypothetical protein
MIRPRLAREARQLLRRIVLRRERSDLINAAWEGPIRERLQVDLSVHREGPHVNGRSDARDLHRLGPEFRNAGCSSPSRSRAHGTEQKMISAFAC